MGERRRRPRQAGPHRLVRRQRRGIQPSVRRDGRERHDETVEPGEAAQQLLGGVGPVGRRAGRGPHVHLQRARGGRRPDQQLGRPGGDARDAARSVRRLHARADDVRGAVLDGSARQPYRAHRDRAVRQSVRRRQHEADDADGTRGVRRAGRRRRVRAVRALGGPAARRRAGRRAVAVQQGHASTSSTSPNRAKSGATARATAATRSSARSASRCGSRR